MVARLIIGQKKTQSNLSKSTFAARSAAIKFQCPSPYIQDIE